ncbi:MAG: ATP-dependent Clp protease adaptor protein ClpS [Gemmataceae bacterium]|nr:ATP-dependent Clp protease adaptor protein ClpS [Gemmataceae bacterium]
MSSRQPFRRYQPRRGQPGRLPTPRYKVFLHRTADKELMFVVRAVMELTRFGNAEAEFRMWEAYHRGRSVVLVTHLERAELYAEQFADRGLSVSIEPE